MKERPSDAELMMWEQQFGGSAAPPLVASSLTALDGDRVVDPFGNPLGMESDLQLGQVLRGGARGRRRRGRKTYRRRSAGRKGRGRSTGRRPRFSLNLRAQIRLRK